MSKYSHSHVAVDRVGAPLKDIGECLILHQVKCVKGVWKNLLNFGDKRLNHHLLLQISGIN